MTADERKALEHELLCLGNADTWTQSIRIRMREIKDLLAKEDEASRDAQG